MGKVAPALKEGVSGSTSPKHTDPGCPPMAQATSHLQPLAVISSAPLPLGTRKSNMVKEVIADPFWYLFLSKYFASLSYK